MPTHHNPCQPIATHRNPRDFCPNQPTAAQSNPLQPNMTVTHCRTDNRITAYWGHMHVTSYLHRKVQSNMYGMTRHCFLFHTAGQQFAQQSKTLLVSRKPSCCHPLWNQNSKLHRLDMGNFQSRPSLSVKKIRTVCLLDREHRPKELSSTCLPACFVVKSKMNA